MKNAAFGMSRRVALVRTDVSEECRAFIIIVYEQRASVASYC
jgi:hypothetical protein